MDSEPQLTRKTSHPQKAIGYMKNKGASEELARALVARDLLRQKEEKWKEQAKKMSMIDPLTGLYNKLWLIGNEQAKPPVKSNLEALFELSQRHGHKLCALMVDLDHFKGYNDNFGHSAGDDALKKLGEMIRQTIRESDFAARFGGEEIFILLPETDLVSGKQLAERLRLAVAQDRSFRRPSTISVGIASYPFNGIFTAKDLFEAADMAVYRSKESGRNKVSVWTENMGF